MTDDKSREAFERLADNHSYPFKGRDRDIAELFWHAALRYRDEQESK